MRSLHYEHRDKTIRENLQYMIMISRARVKVIVGLLVLALLLEASTAKTQGNQHCLPSHCGSFLSVRDPRKCGKRDYELACDNNRTTLSLFKVKYYVEEISYQNNTIRLVDANLDEEDYCSIPWKSFPYSYFPRGISKYLALSPTNTICFITCPAPVRSPNYVDFSACINGSSALQTTHFYAAVGISPVDIPDSCNITVVYLITPDLDYGKLSVSYIHQKLLLGFELFWCESGSFCVHQVPLTERLLHYLKDLQNDLQRGQWNASFITIGGFFVGRTSVGILCLIVLLVYRYRRRHLSMDESIENFLQSNNNFMPIRYSFSEIKRMTKGFKNKLGQGGYGTVFKAKLRSGHPVAIKLLGKSSKANGQDFISEVATIGRIHHVNVVQLVGFCAERSKRALVYDFMPNGSLDKFIFCEAKNKIPLSWKRMYEIALGVARGIEYLHRGCDMRILHFDIKPHNILLDENFVPKVSDFGLAKLYSTNDSIVSLTAARGTLGYIAPELFYKTIGGVSYKADVYSFGMMLIEMVGRRKNVNAFAEHSSQIYFPSWIHDRIYQGEDMELGEITEEFKKLVRKMTIVALWCIQMKPVDRPSMSKVLEMLEGDTEMLQMPPKPSFYPQDNPIEDHRASSSSFVDISPTSQLSALST